MPDNNDETKTDNEANPNSTTPIPKTPSPINEITLRPSPDLKPKNYIKISEAVARNNLGSRKHIQPSLFESWLEEDQDFRQKAKENNITEIGITLSYEEWQSCLAVAKLFTATNYQGNQGDTKHSLLIKRTEYLEAYGLTKRLTKREKWEYKAKDIEKAMANLNKLTQPYLWTISIKNHKLTEKYNEPRYDVIKGIDPLISLRTPYTGVTEKVKNQIQDDPDLIPKDKKIMNKIKYLLIIPSDLFMGLMGGGFLFIPAELFNRIKQTYPKVSEYFKNFVILLCLEAKNNNYKIKRYLSTLSRTLRLEWMEEQRQKKRLRNAINDYCEKAKKLNLLLDYTIEDDMVSITLNPDGFYRKKDKSSQSELKKISEGAE